MLALRRYRVQVTQPAPGMRWLLVVHLFGVFLLVVALLPHPVQAQVVLAEQRDKTQVLLNEAVQELQRVQAQIQHETGSPVSRDQTEHLRRMKLGWQTLVDQYHGQLDVLEDIERQQVELDSVTQARRDWSPPQDGPPWPLEQGDALQRAIRQAELALKQLQERKQTLENERLRLIKERDDAQVRLRLQEEKSLVQSEPMRNEIVTMLLESRLLARMRNERLASLELDRQSTDLALRIRETELRRYQTVRDHHAGRYLLTTDRLTRILADLDDYVAQLRDAETLAMESLGQAQLAVIAARQAISDARQGGKNDLIQAAHQHFELVSSDVERLQSRLDLVRLRLTLTEALHDIWRFRFELYSGEAPTQKEVITLEEQVKQSELRMASLRLELEQVIDVKGHEVFRLRDEMESGSLQQAQYNLAQARLTTARQMLEDAREGIDELRRFSQMLSIIRAEIDQRYHAGDWQLRLGNVYAQALAAFDKVWNFELMTVDDTVRIDGRPFTATHSVTVGKSLGAIVILVLGYVFISAVIRFLLKRAVRHLGLRKASAIVLGRWLRFLALGTLVLISFNLVRIPIGIFAFMGGALAIGVGFGLQNVLKNLISGMMLLAERPVRVGDLVEVDNVKGRIASIGIRFSTIHTSQGTDMHIPNSVLVEQRLINWTYNDEQVRGELRINAPRNIDAETMRRQLIQAALMHPNVLPDPPPTVLFENFDLEQSVFLLRFWVRLTSSVDTSQVASDLRFAIYAGNEALAPWRNAPGTSSGKTGR